MSEAMRPATSSEKWHTQLADKTVAQRIASATDNLTLVEAANPEMEASPLPLRCARRANSTGLRRL
jgi:ATP-dependent helicase/nuclease subunit B